MPAGKHKSRSLRRIHVTTPGGKNKIHYTKRKSTKKKCKECGIQLPGMPHIIDSKFKNLPKTKKRPQRPYAGVLCSKCMRKKIKEQVM
ncbi:50S ribosomal protein L34e [archaeon]|nr:50S ribosomal protein L34e [archaeon]